MAATSMSPRSPIAPALLADPALRAGLVAAVRRRVPAQEVEEIVQATLAEALASDRRPEDPDALRRWVYGIARYKVIDFHRGRTREAPAAELDEPVDGHEPPHDAIDLLRWAEREAPANETSARTLEWLLREGDGEKLEDIARAEAVPAPQVRQRVARLRKHYRARWALVAAALVVATIVVLALRGRDDDRTAKPEPTPSTTPDPIARARELRERALSACERHEWTLCLKGLDDAAALDPAGDTTQVVRDARAAAQKALAPAPSSQPSPTPTPTPSASVTAAPPPPTKTFVPIQKTKVPSKPGPSKKTAPMDFE